MSDKLIDSHLTVSYTHLDVYKRQAYAKCRHQWLIEFAVMPDSLENVSQGLDLSLIHIYTGDVELLGVQECTVTKQYQK